MYIDCKDEEGIKRYFEEKQKLNELLIHEELYWQQRAKAFWLEEGDPNSKFFYTYETKRKKMNRVSKLRNEEGELVENHEEMC